jgi:hypothetical protein
MKKLFIIFISSLTLFNKLYAFSPTIGIIGGYSKLYNLTFFTDEIQREGLGLNNGYNVGFKAGIYLSSFGFTSKFRYFKFIAKGDCFGVIEPQHSMIIPHHVSTIFDIKSFSIGTEYILKISKLVQPFIYFDYCINGNIHSKINKQPKNKNQLPPPYDYLRNDFSFDENKRHGLIIGIGFNVQINKKISTGISIDYNKFYHYKNKYSLDSIYSFVLMQENISLITLNTILNFNYNGT